jgi:hypothetical protein
MDDLYNWWNDARAQEQQGQLSCSFQQARNMGEKRACNGMGVFHKQVQAFIVKVVCDVVYQEVKRAEVWKEKGQTASHNCVSARP